MLSEYPSYTLIEKKRISHSANHFFLCSRYAIIGVTEQLLHGRIDRDCKLFINNINKFSY